MGLRVCIYPITYFTTIVTGMPRLRNLMHSTLRILKLRKEGKEKKVSSQFISDTLFQCLHHKCNQNWSDPIRPGLYRSDQVCPDPTRSVTLVGKMTKLVLHVNLKGVRLPLKSVNLERYLALS
jgi:hypothetical protein